MVFTSTFNTIEVNRMDDLILYVAMVLIGVAYVVLDEQIEGEKEISPINMFIEIHLGFVCLIVVAVYYMVTGKYIRAKPPTQ